MRLIKLTIALLLCIGWVWLLNAPRGILPAVGKLLDPYSGFWANAEPVKNAAGLFHFPGERKISVQIRFDERMVPHVQAQNNHDLYLAQGYLHAWYRLWQMDMQTRAAAGRISEVAGEKTLAIDRKQRRKGMIWAAENSLHAMEADPVTRDMLNAYTEGVNLYISQLQYKDYPLEYKLMGFNPEPWTNLKCALLLKYMADALTGSVDDIAMSYLRTTLPAAELDDLFPDKIKGSQPVIPAGTAFDAPSLRVPPVPAGELFARFDTAASNANLRKQHADSSARRLAWLDEPGGSAAGIGSNNWAIGRQLTSDSGALLCNDPHLDLNLPSIWYEQQLTAPGINCYGVSIPGAPGIIIGFNDSISWGFTNNYRDVKDFYEIRSDDPRLYFFDGKEVPFNVRIERIFVKGKAEPVVDTVRYSVHGPVMYDENFPEPSGSGKMLAMTWMAHRATNELRAIYQYNRAVNYAQWVEGIQHFECPAQNFAFADRLGNIAIWGQGRFINKWKDQGKFVMRGDISATLWGDTIPMRENPHVLNPPRGFVASANQNVTDPAYPYYYNGDFTEFRSWEIQDRLAMLFAQRKDSTGLSAQAFRLPLSSGYTAGRNDMDINGSIQNDNTSLLNYLLYSNSYVKAAVGAEKTPYFLDADSEPAAFFQLFWNCLYKNIWEDEFHHYPDPLYPSAERTLFLVLNDSVSKYYDNIATAKTETLNDLVQLSRQQALDSMAVLKKARGTAWYQVKNTSLTHLARLAAFSYEGIKTGGWGNTINAMKATHGPSWRMIVRMAPNAVQAYVVYPGGQSGNPGSRYYADMVDYWAAGKYYKVQLK